MVVAPDLIDANEWEIVGQAVAPTVTGDAEGVADSRGQNAEELVAGGQVEIAAEDYWNIGGNFLHFAGQPSELFALMYSIFTLFAPASGRPQVGANAIRGQPDAEDLDNKPGRQFDACMAERRTLRVAGSNHCELATRDERDIGTSEELRIRSENSRREALDDGAQGRFLEENNIGIVIRDFSGRFFIAGGAVQGNDTQDCATGAGRVRYRMVKANKAAEFLDETDRVEEPKKNCYRGHSFARTGPGDDGEQKSGKNPQPSRQHKHGGADVGLEPEDESGGQAQRDGSAGKHGLEPGGLPGEF